MRQDSKAYIKGSPGCMTIILILALIGLMTIVKALWQMI